MHVQTQNRARVGIASFLLFCLALFLTAYSSKHPQVASLGSSIIAELIRPFQLVHSGTANSISNFWKTYLDLIGVKEENTKLKQRLELLEAENSKLMEFESELSQLRALLNISKENKLHGVAAEIIGRSPSNWEAVVVDKGTLDGIRVGMPALGHKGIVGQVMQVSPNSANILLITDRASAVDAIVQGTRTRGIVEGSTKGSCELRYVLQEDEIKIGDNVVTSGIDSVYPKGLIIGVVVAIRKVTPGLFRSVRVKPAEELSKIERLLIVQNDKGSADGKD